MLLHLIWGMLIVAGFFAQRSKLVTAAIIIFMVVAIGFRTQGADYGIYLNEYLWSADGLYPGAHYPGYVYLQMMSHSLGFDYTAHLLSCAALSIVLYVTGIGRLSNGINIVLALFLIYPFAHEAVQVRSFLADSMILVVMPFLLREKTSRRQLGLDAIIFLVGTALATTVHFLAAFYAVCAILYLASSKRDNALSVFIIAAVLFILIIAGILPDVLGSLNSRVSYWLSERTGLGVVIPIIFTVCIWMMVRYLSHVLDGGEDGASKKTIPVASIAKYSNYVLLLIPFFACDITFNRLWRVFLILLFVLYSMCLESNGIRPIEKMLAGFAVVILLVAIAIYESDFSIAAGFFSGNALVD